MLYAWKYLVGSVAVVMTLIVCSGWSSERDVAYEADNSPLFILFWNVENLFDGLDSGNCPADYEFSYSGARRWTRKRFKNKCNAIAKALLWISSMHNRPPDIIGLAEVENRSVLKYLSSETALWRIGYDIVHYDSNDPRGIDVGLLYRKDRLKLIDKRPFPILLSPLGNDTLPTRDILFTGFIKPQGDSLAVLVNHHPSKYGGRVSEPRRAAAVRTMFGIKDSLSILGYKEIVSMGDFNDVPGNEVLQAALRRQDAATARFHNLAALLDERGQGSIRFDGTWELIDMFFVTDSVKVVDSMRVVKVPFLMQWDKTHPGYKPFRTYQGPKYIGGVSDHLPITLVIE